MAWEEVAGNGEEVVAERNQGFRWYMRKLRIEEDGDVADEFLDEVVPESLINNDASPVGRFHG